MHAAWSMHGYDLGNCDTYGSSRVLTAKRWSTGSKNNWLLMKASFSTNQVRGIFRKRQILIPDTVGTQPHRQQIESSTINFSRREERLLQSGSKGNTIQCHGVEIWSRTTVSFPEVEFLHLPSSRGVFRFSIQLWGDLNTSLWAGFALVVQLSLSSLWYE